MTSEEIKKYKMQETGIDYEPLWLKEIAYQLAVANERRYSTAPFPTPQQFIPSDPDLQKGQNR